MNISEDEKAPESTKEKIKEIVKDGSGLTLLKISATALTAVSMSLLSAKLTGVVNTLILVALVSVGTAVISEFYRIVLSVTSLGAKKVVAPVISTTRIFKDVDGNVQTITRETEIIDEETLKSAELEEEVRETGKGKSKLVWMKIKHKIHNYLTRNPLMKFVLLFLGIAIITVSVSYFVSENNQNTDNIFTTVYKTEKTTETLTEEEKQKIIDEAVAEAKKSTPPTTIVEKETTVEKETQPSGDNVNNVTESSTVTEEELNQLKKRITELENDNKTLSDKLDTVQGQPEPVSEPSQEDNEELKQEIEDLKLRIDELEKADPVVTPDVASEPTSPTVN